MAQTHDMTAPEMTRVAVRVPCTTLDQINAWVDTLGVRRSHFLGIALVAGVRSLIQASALEVPFGSLRSLNADVGLQSAPGRVASDMPGDRDSLSQLVRELRSEVARLHAEIADLRAQLPKSRQSGRKRSKGNVSSTRSQGYTLEKGGSDGQRERQAQGQEHQENQENQEVIVRTTSSLSKKGPTAKAKDRPRSGRKAEGTFEKPK